MAFTETERLKSLPAYLFVEIDRRKREAIAAGQDVIDFGIGDPDQPTPAFIREAMRAAIDRPELHRYPLGGGRPEFRQAVTDFFQKRYGVGLDPQREVLALIGSKEGIGHLPLAVVNPGDPVIVPAPGYPVYQSGAIFAGGQPWVLELSAAKGWLADLEAIPADVARQAKLLFLNYPNNPTGAIADLAFFERAVAFAKKYDLVLAHDAAYNEMYLGGSPKPPSVLQIPGAKDVAIEFHSASKTFNMTGWRVGFAVGNPAVLAALGRLKSNLDSGVFGAIQEAAIAAYRGFERPEIEALRALYHQRAEVLCSALAILGFKATIPKATFYVWAGVPAGTDSMTVCQRLLAEASVVGVPGKGFGRAGEGFVRFSLSVPTERIQAAAERMRALRW